MPFRVQAKSLTKASKALQARHPAPRQLPILSKSHLVFLGQAGFTAVYANPSQSRSLTSGPLHLSSLCLELSSPSIYMAVHPCSFGSAFQSLSQRPSLPTPYNAGSSTPTCPSLCKTCFSWSQRTHCLIYCTFTSSIFHHQSGSALKAETAPCSKMCLQHHLEQSLTDK